MSLHYSRDVLKVCVAQISQSLGWNAIQSTPLEILADLLERYMIQLGSYTRRYCEQFGRTDANIDDLAMTFNHMGISLAELEDYFTHMDPIPYPRELVQFPIPKETDLHFANPSSKEVLEKRPEHVPSYLPYMYPKPAEEPDDDGKSIETTTQSVASPIIDVCLTPGSADKISGVTDKTDKPATPSLDSATFKRVRSFNNLSLPEEAGPSTYNPTLSLDVNGYPVYKGGLGRLPTSTSAPAALKQLLVVLKDDAVNDDIDDIFNIVSESHVEVETCNADEKYVSKEAAKFGKKLTSQKLKKAKKLAKSGGKYAKGKYPSKVKEVMSKYKHKHTKEKLTGGKIREDKLKENEGVDSSDLDEVTDQSDGECDDKPKLTKDKIIVDVKSGESESNFKSHKDDVKAVPVVKRPRGRPKDSKKKKIVEEVKPERTTPVELRVFDFTASPERDDSKPVKLRVTGSPEKKAEPKRKAGVGKGKRPVDNEPKLFDVDAVPYTAMVIPSNKLNSGLKEKSKVTDGIKTLSPASVKSDSDTKDKSEKWRHNKKGTGSQDQIDKKEIFIKDKPFQRKEIEDNEHKEKSKKDKHKDKEHRHDKKDRHRDKDKKKNRDRDHSHHRDEPASSSSYVPKLKLKFSGHELMIDSPVSSPAGSTKTDKPKIVFKNMKPDSDTTKSSKHKKESRSPTPSSRGSSPAPKKYKSSESVSKKLLDSKLDHKADFEIRKRSPSPPPLTRHKSPSPPLLSKQSDQKPKQRAGLNLEDFISKPEDLFKDVSRESKIDQINLKVDKDIKSQSLTDVRVSSDLTSSPTKRNRGRPPKKRPNLGQNLNLNLDATDRMTLSSKSEELILSPVTVDIPRLSTRKIEKSQDLPPMPPSSKDKPVERAVFVETMDMDTAEVQDELGEKIWICPCCKEEDDGSPMIGCDVCDDWYHWVCLNITEEPADEQWYCPKCVGEPMPAPSSKSAKGKGRGRGKGKRKKKL